MNGPTAKQVSGVIIVISLSDLTTWVIVSNIPVTEREHMTWFHLRERLDLVWDMMHTHTHTRWIKKWNIFWQAARHTHITHTGMRLKTPGLSRIDTPKTEQVGGGGSGIILIIIYFLLFYGIFYSP